MLHCHHFISQHVLPVEDEPVSLCCTGRKVFVATECCQIEQFDIAAGQCKLVNRFPTVAVVKEMAYCATGDFLVTIESVTSRCRKMNDGGKGIIRVYANLRDCGVGSEPMKARVAGQMASLRLSSCNISIDNVNCFSMIEIPLKDNPKCVAVDCKTRNIAISMMPVYSEGSTQCRILIYGLCCKKVAGSKLIYRDVKCLMELTFALEIRRLNICEEFLVCSSTYECQLIQMKFDRDKSERMPASRQTASRFMRSPAVSEEFIDSLESRNDSTKACSIASSGRSSVQLSSESTVSQNLDCFVNRSNAAEIVKRLTACASSEKLVINRAFKRTANVDGDLLVGPVKGSTSPCPVSVEFEDSCECNDIPSGVLNNGVVTWLYKKQYARHKNSGGIIAVQLLPVYLDQDISTSVKSSGEKQRNCFISSRRRQLCGLFCFISSPSMGYLYSVLNGIDLVTTFIYACDILQAEITVDRLFTMSSSSFDVYTCHCLSYLASCSKSSIDENGNALASDKSSHSETTEHFESCHVGSNRFVGLSDMRLMKGHVALMSKVYENDGSENNWSVYVLCYPDTLTFHADMMELTAMYKDTDKKAYQTLVAEACLVQDATSFFGRVASNDILHASEDRQPTAGVDDVDFGCRHLPPSGESNGDTLPDAVCTSASGNRILLVADTEVYRGLVDHRPTAVDFELGVSENGDVTTLFRGVVDARCTPVSVSSSGDLGVVPELGVVDADGTSDVVDRGLSVTNSFPAVVIQGCAYRNNGDHRQITVGDGSGLSLDVVRKGIDENVTAFADVAASEVNNERFRHQIVMVDSQRVVLNLPEVHDLNDRLELVCSSGPEQSGDYLTEKARTLTRQTLCSKDIVAIERDELVIDGSFFSTETSTVDRCENISDDSTTRRQHGEILERDEVGSRFIDQSQREDLLDDQSSFDIIVVPVADRSSVTSANENSVTGLDVSVFDLPVCRDCREGLVLVKFETVH